MFGLGTGLRQLVDALDGAVDAIYRASDCDFRARFFPYLRLLEDRDSLSVGGLTAMLGFTQPAVTQTLALMRESGLVELAASTDRRERRYRLTARARKMLPALRNVWTAVDRAAASLDAELPAPLGATVERALQHLSQVPFSQMIEEELRRVETDGGPVPAVAATGRPGAAEGADRP